MFDTMPGLRLGALCLATLFAIACGGGDDPTQPPPISEGSIPINVGDTVSGVIEGAGALVFTMPASGEAAIFAQSPDGPLDILIRDSATSQLITVGGAGATLQLLDSRTDRFQAAPGSRVQVDLVRSWNAALSPRFRLLVYPVSRGPERAAAAYQLGTVVSDEPLETSADIDEFMVEGTAGAEWIAYAAHDSTQGSGSLTITWVGPDGVTRGSGSVKPAGTPLADAGAAFASLTTTGTYTLRFSGNVVPVAARLATYDFQVRARNRAPESRPPALAPGDSVGNEVIEFAGDVDEFVLNGAPGSLVNLFFALPSASGDPRRGFSLIVRNSARVQLRQVDASVAAGERNTGRLRIPDDGQLLLEVASDASAGQYGSYQIVAYPIVVSPEQASTSHLSASDSVLVEGIDREGDVDEFTLSFPANRQLNLVWRRPPGAVGGLAVDVRNNAGEIVAPIPGVGLIPLAAGSYRVIVREPDSFNSGSLQTRGPYQLYVYAIDPAPETAPVTLNLDQSVAGERIDPLGDIDTFAFAGVRGQVVRLRLDAPVAGALAADLFDYTQPNGPPGTTVGLIATTRSGSASLPAELGTTGQYGVRVAGSLGAGAYSVGVETVPTQPEAATPMLSTGVPVTSEAIDIPGDIDDFVLQGTPGSEFIVTILRNASSAGGDVCADVREENSPNRLGAMYSTGFREATQRLRFPASGAVRVRVWMVQNNFCPMGTLSVPTSSATAGYELLAYHVNPAPELVSSVIAVGDTIRGEIIGHDGDIDEFTVTLQAGERVVPAVLEVFPQFNPPGRLLLHVFDPDGTRIGGASSELVSGSWRAGAPVIAPVTGTYRIQLGVFTTNQSPTGTGSYQFTLSP